MTTPDDIEALRLAVASALPDAPWDHEDMAYIVGCIVGPVRTAWGLPVDALLAWEVSVGVSGVTVTVRHAEEVLGAHQHETVLAALLSLRVRAQGECIETLHARAKKAEAGGDALRAAAREHLDAVAAYIDADDLRAGLTPRDPKEMHAETWHLRSLAAKRMRAAECALREMVTP